MNAAATRMTQTTLFEGGFSGIRVSGISLTMVLLIAIVVLSALSLVYVKNLQRVTTAKLQAAVKVQAQLQMEHSQLLVEQSTWATPSRVSSVAQSKLQLMAPRPDKIRYISS